MDVVAQMTPLDWTLVAFGVAVVVLALRPWRFWR
jgi:hypothetical protein